MKNKKIEDLSEDFKECYNKLDANLVKEMDNYRKKIIRAEIQTVICILGCFVVFYLQFTIKLSWQGTKIIACLLTLMILGFVASMIACVLYEYHYKKKLKEEMIPQFAKYVNPNLTYINFGRNMGKFSNSNIMSEYNNAEYDDIIVTKLEKESDIIFGTLDSDISFQISEIKVYQEYVNDEGRNIEYMTFEGFFSWNETYIDIHNSLKININDNARKKIDKVHMDSSKFEEIFDVYCDDKILAMRILALDVMEMLLDFYYKSNLGFEICYKNNKIYIRYFTEELFNMRHMSSTNNMDKYYSIFKFSTDFVKKITKSVEDIGL